MNCPNCGGIMRERQGQDENGREVILYLCNRCKISKQELVFDDAASKCPDCGKEYPESYDYCKNCVEYELKNFEIELHDLLLTYPDVSIIAKGPNIVLRHVTGEEKVLGEI